MRLLAQIHRAKERQDVDRRVGDVLGKALGGAQDLALSRKEGEDGASLCCQCGADRADHLILDPRGGIAAEIACLHVEGAAVACDHRCVVEKG